MQNLAGPSYGNTTNPDKIVIFLHGYGANGKDLISIAPYFQKNFPNALFTSPNAPFPCEMAVGYQWFSMEQSNEDFFYQGMLEAAPYLFRFINELLVKFNLTYKDLYFMGFSQGAMMSLYVAPRLDGECGGVISYSGAVIKADILAQEIRYTPPVLLIHGDSDEVINQSGYFAAKVVLEKLKFPLQDHLIPNMGHTINEEALALGIKFFR